MVLVPIILGAATGSIIAYARFLWRCAQPIKHGSEDFADCAWGDVIAFPHIADRHLDFGSLKAGVGTSTGEGASNDASLQVTGSQTQFKQNVINSTSNCTQTRGETVPLKSQYARAESTSANFGELQIPQNRIAR